MFRILGCCPKIWWVHLVPSYNSSSLSCGARRPWPHLRLYPKTWPRGANLLRYYAYKFVAKKTPINTKDHVFFQGSHKMYPEVYRFLPHHLLSFEMLWVCNVRSVVLELLSDSLGTRVNHSICELAIPRRDQTMWITISIVFYVSIALCQA